MEVSSYIPIVAIGNATNLEYPTDDTSFRPDLSGLDTLQTKMQPVQSIQEQFSELYSESLIAKILRVAMLCRIDDHPIDSYPEYVPQTGPGSGRYVCREAEFWTCGFFPGSIYSLLERYVKYPKFVPGNHRKLVMAQKLQELGEIWSDPLFSAASRTDTHDMSFMIQPSMRKRWELLGDKEALASIILAGKSLYSRYNPRVGAIRSWDKLTQTGVNISSMDQDFLVIIDSMMNLDLLYYAAAHSDRQDLSTAATEHAHTVRKALLRHETGAYSRRNGYSGPLFSTYHVANLSPATGGIKELLTGQGYEQGSTWARGQAWGIFGFAQTYSWTGDPSFLEAACGLAEYFLLRLETSPPCVERNQRTCGVSAANGASESSIKRTCGRYVPLWDFDAPVDEEQPLRDSSAGIIAANGMLVLSQSLAKHALPELSHRYQQAALTLVEDLLKFSLAEERAAISFDGEEIIISDAQPGKRFDAVLKNATANHNAKDHRRYWDHGLVYGDYYLIEFGNRLLQIF